MIFRIFLIFFVLAGLFGPGSVPPVEVPVSEAAVPVRYCGRQSRQLLRHGVAPG